MDPDAHIEGDESVNSLEGAFATTERDQIGTNELLRIVMEENRRRDELLLTMINRLSASSSAQSSVQATPSFHIMPDLTKTIKTFNGEGDGDQAKQWIDNISSMQTLHSWPDSFALETARTHLVGGAKHWYTARAQELQDWAEFRSKFKKTFVGEISMTSKWQRMVERTQKKNETISEYYHEKVKYCQDLHLCMTEIKEQVLIGLWSRELCNMVAGKQHNDQDALLHDLLQFDELNRVRRERFKTQRPNEKSNMQKPQEQNSTTQPVRESNTDGKQKSVVRNEKREFKCYNCNMSGHLSRDCPKPKLPIRCFKCNEEGHVSRQCSKNQVMQVVNNDNCALKFLKSVKLNDATVASSMIDTGATVCTIRKSVAQRADLSPEFLEKPIVLTGFGVNNETKCFTKIRASLEVDDIKVDNIDLIIVPDESQQTEIIIGRTFTEREEIAYVRIGNKLKFGYCWDAPFKEIDLEADTVKGHNTMNRMAEKTQNDDNLVVTRQETCYRNTMCLISAKLNDVDEEVVVPVMNVGNKNIEVCKGQVLGRNVKMLNSSMGHETTNDRSGSVITSDEVKTGEKVNKTEKFELVTLLNKYRCCFAKNINELGCTTVTKMDIVEKEGSQPVCMKPYRATMAERNEIKRIVREWKDNDLVTETRSAYASPVILVKKKDGDSRLVVEYRQLNKQTVKQSFPLPQIDEQLEQLSGCTMFSVLDLAHGYLQVPLTQQAQEKTAFVTPDETGMFRRMTFGLMNSPYEFTRLMNKVLGDLKNRVALCYVDDILIPAKNWSDMMERLEKVFEALKAANLTLKLTKCEFGKGEVDYLGFTISNGKLKPGKRKLEAITAFPEPKNLHELRRFLGLTSFFRRFVLKHAIRASPLTELTKSGKPFVWGEAQQTAFDDLKKALSNEPVLSLYNPNAYTELHTDASAVGLAAMLMQKGADGAMHLVYCISKKTTEAEGMYHSSKLELMAIVWGVDRLRQFLLEIHFTVITDCQSIVYMNAMRTKNAQIARWSALLQEYDLEIKHRAGDKMCHVDALSRAPVERCEDTEDQILKRGVFIALTEEEFILTIQHADPKLREIIETLNKAPELQTKTEKRMANEYAVRNGRLFRLVNVQGRMKWLYVLPLSMRKSTLIKFHDMMGHPAVDNTVDKITQNYWFPSIRRYAKHHIRRCIECILNKLPGGKQAGELHPIPPGRRPYSVIHVDHLGPFVQSSRKNNMLMILVDNMTKFVHLYPMPRAATKYVITALKKFILERGAPDRIITDRGTCFTSREFAEFCVSQGVRHTLNSSRHPQANGQVERVNRRVLPIIIATMKDPNHRDWDSRLNEVQRDLNCTLNKTTGRTPFELLYGYRPRHEGALKLLVDDDEANYTEPAKLREEAVENITKSQEKFKEQYDKRRHANTHYDIGEIVFMKRAPEYTGESRKTQPKYRGPLVVTEVLPSDTYRVAQIGTDQKRLYATTAHVSQLKSYAHPACEQESESSEDEEVDHLPSTEAAEGCEADQGRKKVPWRSRRLPARLRTDYKL